MNMILFGISILISFLNGVCRHERVYAQLNPPLIFLNGVCRHERLSGNVAMSEGFLNGVCRHELKKAG